MEFAKYEPEVQSEAWPDALVRPIHADDASAVAALLAQRQGWDVSKAMGDVNRWGASERRFVIVAERAGQTLGYGKCDLLDPVGNGGDAPSGWYLSGLVVEPRARRHGLGRMLTEERIRLLRGHADALWYCANLKNPTTIALHAGLGFLEYTRDFRIPGIEFTGGSGALFRLDLSPSDASTW